MANRTTTHILKNSNVISRPLPTALLKGEPIVNTADGIMYFSGNTLSTSGWTAAGTGTTSTFFEVGSNLYDLSLRHRIIQYDGNSGSNLSGKFLSGTSTGFALANISSITGTSSSVTGFTYSNNTFTISQSQGLNPLTASINSVTGLTVNGILSAATISSSTVTLTDLFLNGTIKSYSGVSNVSGMFLSGTSSGFILAPISSITTSGTAIDSYVTGFTYAPTTNTLTIAQNQGLPALSLSINTVSGLTISNLTANRMVYTSTGGLLTTGSAIFDGTNMTLPTTGSLSVGTGGVSVLGDVNVSGNLTVLGSAISAFTSELYVEDNNVIINYNPTGSTSGTSIGAGFTIQDGNGVNGGNVTLDIRAMNGFTGLTASQIPSVTEYNGSTGNANRAFVTQLADIVIRSTNTTTPNGVRVLAEWDVLDGGTY